MSTVVQDCPRCRSNRMTFDVIADVHVGSAYDWQHHFEVFSVCRRCHRPTVMRVKLRDIAMKNRFNETGTVTAIAGDIEPTFEFDRLVDVADAQARPSPTDLPPDIEQAFLEGARCLAVGCPNASAAMFRLCLDVATKSMLPTDATEPDKHTRRNLAPRLRWLFDNKLLPEDLRGLSAAVKDQGDDGAHDGNLDQHDVEDIYDFAFALLERLYTHPARLAAALKRREERRAPK